MADGFKGKGVKIQIGNTTDGASSTWTDIACLRESPSGPNRTVTAIDATHHESDAKEKVPGLKDSGQVTFRALYDPTQTSRQTLNTLYDSSLTRDFKIIAPNTDASTVQFVAFVQSIGEEYPLEDMTVFDCTLEISGVCTYSV